MPRQKIIEMLKYQTREEAAKELNYKNWKSLDMYMRRKNFVYDRKQGQYIPAQNRDKKDKKAYRHSAPDKVLRIIDALTGKTRTQKGLLKKKDLKTTGKWRSI